MFSIRYLECTYHGREEELVTENSTEEGILAIGCNGCSSCGHVPENGH